MKLVCSILLMAGAGWLTVAAAAPVKKKPVATASSTASKKTGAGSRTSASTVKRATPLASRRPASSKAIYSRNRRASQGVSRNTKQHAASHSWQARPSPERYTEIQQALAEKGFYKGESNGVWGPESVTALKDFQRSQNLEPDGKLGSLSLIALGMGPKRIIAAADPGGAAATVPPAVEPAVTAPRAQ